jgi:hypothetical protein
MAKKKEKKKGRSHYWGYLAFYPSTVFEFKCEALFSSSAIFSKFCATFAGISDYFECSIVPGFLGFAVCCLQFGHLAMTVAIF